MDNNKIAQRWAEEQGMTEEEAFEWAVKSSKIKKNDFEIDDKYEQAYRQGRKDQEKEDERLIAENADLRHQIRVLNDMNMRMREAILHHTDLDYD